MKHINFDISCLAAPSVISHTNFTHLYHIHKWQSVHTVKLSSDFKICVYKLQVTYISGKQFQRRILPYLFSSAGRRRASPLTKLTYDIQEGKIVFVCNQASQSDVTRGLEVWLHTFLTLSVNKGECLIHYPATLA